MAEHENVEILRRLYAKWADQSLDSSDWMDALADDVRWCSIGNELPAIGFSGPAVSKSDVARYFENLAKHWQMLHYDVNEFVAQGERVVMIGRCGWKSKDTGKTVETPKVDIFRLRDGKVTEFFELFDTAKALEAARGEAIGQR